MTSSIPLDQELENFGWSEKFITSKSLESYNSVVDKTMIIAIFLIIYVYCLIELFFELTINQLKKNIFIPQMSLSGLNEFFALPRVSIR